jgi:polar amino acid transport system substrate-binding protein
MLESGQADIVMAALVNHERDQYAVFVPYMQQRFATLVHRDVPLSKTTLSGFSADPSLHFGAVRGVNYGAGRDAVYAQMEAQHRLELGPTLPMLFRMFKSRRFDAMFAVPLQFEKELADAGMRDSVRVVDWFPGAPSSERSLAMSRKNFSAEQVRGWREVVQTMKADGTMRRILSRYLPPGEVAKALIK